LGAILDRCGSHEVASYFKSITISEIDFCLFTSEAEKGKILASHKLTRIKVSEKFAAQAIQNLLMTFR
jgi:hypothetical protein